MCNLYCSATTCKLGRPRYGVRINLSEKVSAITRPAYVHACTPMYMHVIDSPDRFKLG